MTMYNETYGTPWSTGNQPPHRWFSPDCYAGINMAERHPRDDFSLWPPVQTGSPASDAHSPMSTAVAADLFKWKTSNHSHMPPDFGNISTDAMNNNLHHVVRHESTSSTSSYRSNGASGVNSPTTQHNNNSLPSGAPLVIPQPVKPTQNKTTNKTYQCKMCDQVFNTKSDMLIHSQQVHKQDMKPYRCPQCQKCFANSSYLSQHNRIHAGIKPYKCEICERKFTQLSHLQQHIRTHTGEKPYKCHHGGCGKAFSQLSNLQSHSRSHMTDKPYRCNSCYKCYADEAGLREHIPKHSETKHIKTQICKICGKAYTQETYLARHMLKHTNENVKLQQRSVKQEPSEHSNLDAVDFTRILERVERAQENNTPCPTLKSPGSSVSSAFMPLSQFGVSSSNASGYPYGPALNSSGLSTNNLNSSLPHISSMSNPRYFPYDPIGFRKNEQVDRLVNDRLVNDRLVNDRLMNERLERNINVPITTRPENMLPTSFLSLQHIKNYASQQMPPSFSPCPGGTSRLT